VSSYDVPTVALVWEGTKVSLVAVNGSPSDTSKTHALAAAAVDLAGGGELINVGSLDADALLLRGKDPSVTDAIGAITAARPLVLVTPVYRATYSGLLKLLLDQLSPDSFAGTPVVLAATGGSAAHYLSLDTGLRAVVASLGGWSAPTVVYATPADFSAEGSPLPSILDPLRGALVEVAQLS
jgi:FMN reductase